MKPKIELGDEVVFHHFAKEWRKYKKISQTEIARRLGVTQSEISKIDKLDRRVKASDLAAYAFALGIDVEDLILVNPLQPDAPKLVYSKLLHVDKDKQRQVLDVVMALLKEAI